MPQFSANQTIVSNQQQLLYSLILSLRQTHCSPRLKSRACRGSPPPLAFFFSSFRTGASKVLSSPVSVLNLEHKGFLVCGRTDSLLYRAGVSSFPVLFLCPSGYSGSVSALSLEVVAFYLFKSLRRGLGRDSCELHCYGLQPPGSFIHRLAGSLMRCYHYLLKKSSETLLILGVFGLHG